MSHIPERKEKDCLNCGTIVQGRYCQHCGQENVVPKETFWHMFTHFFYDITHFDSSFFHTVHHLILKPGFLSSEYMAGKRKYYLHPVRMYVFTSAMFFLLFFSLFKPSESIKTDIDNAISSGERNKIALRLENKLKKDTTDAALRNLVSWLKDTSRVITSREMLKLDKSDINIISFSDGVVYNTFEEYDSVQSTYTKDKRDGWLKRRFVKRAIEINNKYRQDPEEAFKKFTEGLLHRLPYLLFVSLPLFALILKLVYFRRKQFYYADHGVFTIHTYVFTFLVLMVIFGITKLDEATGWNLGLGIAALFLFQYFYLYKAMKRFYGQRRAKTILKFLLVTFLSFIMMLLLLLIFLFFSAITF